MSPPRVTYHTLSKPEILWLDFFRFFFSQRFLFVNDDGSYVKNNFFLDRAISADNRPFDVLLSFEFSSSNQNILPAVVIEDVAGASQLGLTIDQRRDHAVSPLAMVRKADQVRYSYVFHCVSRERGESRALAATVGRAIGAFRGEILRSPLGVVKVDPWSIGVTQPIRSTSKETYLDTPVQVTFYMMDQWSTFTIEGGTAESFCVYFVPPSTETFIRSCVEVKNPDISSFIRSSALIANPNSSFFVSASLEAEDPLVSEQFISSSVDVEDPESVEAFIRASTRVA